MIFSNQLEFWWGEENDETLTGIKWKLSTDDLGKENDVNNQGVIRLGQKKTLTCMKDTMYIGAVDHRKDYTKDPAKKDEHKLWPQEGTRVCMKIKAHGTAPGEPDRPDEDDFSKGCTKRNGALHRSYWDDESTNSNPGFKNAYFTGNGNINNPKLIKVTSTTPVYNNDGDVIKPSLPFQSGKEYVITLTGIEETRPEDRPNSSPIDTAPNPSSPITGLPEALNPNPNPGPVLNPNPSTSPNPVNIPGTPNGPDPVVPNPPPNRAIYTPVEFATEDDIELYEPTAYGKKLGGKTPSVGGGTPPGNNIPNNNPPNNPGVGDKQSRCWRQQSRVLGDNNPGVGDNNPGVGGNNPGTGNNNPGGGITGPGNLGTDPYAYTGVRIWWSKNPDGTTNDKYTLAGNTADRKRGIIKLGQNKIFKCPSNMDGFFVGAVNFKNAMDMTDFPQRVVGSVS